MNASPPMRAKEMTCKHPRKAHIGIAPYVSWCLYCGAVRQGFSRWLYPGRGEREANLYKLKRAKGKR